MSAFLTAVILAGCSDELTYIPGEPDETDNYGVYFPAQTAATEIELESGSRPQITYKVKRTNINDEITVPVVVTPSEKNIFIVEPIHFAAGENETSFTVYFPEAKIGTEYTCALRIEDPRYISIYGSRQTGLSFSVLRADWKLLGKGRWRDDVISSLYSPLPNPNAEIDVTIYERTDKKGYYRMEAYTPDLMEALFEVRAGTEGKRTIIDATDPEKVWIPKQSTGVTIIADDGYITIASYVDKQFSIDASDSQYGTLSNGVITFPVQSIMCNLSKYMAADEWARGNVSGLQRIMLPGARLSDYSVTLTSSDAENGVVKIAALFGEDTRKMRYSIFKGVLDAGQVSLNAQEMHEKQLFEAEISESGTFDVRIEPEAGTTTATGMYTLVGCIYGEDDKTMQEYASVSFGYISAGDEKPVVFTYGLEATNELAGQGVTSDNAVKFYAYGEAITQVEYGLYRTDKIAGKNPETLLAESGKVFTAEELEQVNQKSFRTMLTGLNGDSDYTLILRVHNGYTSKLMSATHRTTGQFNPAMEDYTAKDFIATQPTREQLKTTTWNYYRTDLREMVPTRKYVGKVTISDSETGSYLALSGFLGLKFDKEGEGKVNVQFTNGFMAINVDKGSYGTVDGQHVFLEALTEEDNYSYTGQGLMVGGAVAEGYIFFVPNPDHISVSGLTFSSILIKKGAAYVARMTDMLLVDAEKDITKLPAEVTTQAVRLKELVEKCREPKNCVELRGFDRLKALVQEEPEVLNLAKGMIPAGAPTAQIVHAKVEFIPATRNSASANPARCGQTERLVFR